MSKAYIQLVAFNVDNQYKQEITLTVDSAYKATINKVFKSNLIRPTFMSRKDNDQRQFRTTLRESVQCYDGTTLCAGKAVSFFPLIGIRPNSKRRGTEYEFDFSNARFCEKRHTPAISINDWWDWIKSNLPYETWMSNRSFISDDPSESNRLPVLTGSELILLSDQPTKLDRLVEAGLTRAEAIEVITSKVYTDE